MIRTRLNANMSNLVPTTYAQTLLLLRRLGYRWAQLVELSVVTMKINPIGNGFPRVAWYILW
jgi:hypothetical protein